MSFAFGRPSCGRALRCVGAPNLRTCGRALHCGCALRLRLRLHLRTCLALRLRLRCGRALRCVADVRWAAQLADVP
jgi:hypothetical protein